MTMYAGGSSHNNKNNNRSDPEWMNWTSESLHVKYGTLWRIIRFNRTPTQIPQLHSLRPMLSVASTHSTSPVRASRNLICIDVAGGCWGLHCRYSYVMCGFLRKIPLAFLAATLVRISYDRKFLFLWIIIIIIFSTCRMEFSIYIYVPRLFFSCSSAAGKMKVSFADFTGESLFFPIPSHCTVLSWAWEIFPGLNEDDNRRNMRKVSRTVTGRRHRAIKKRKDVILKSGFRIASDILLSPGKSGRTGQSPWTG